MIAPFVLMTVLFFRAVTLPNAGEGIRYYILSMDFGKLFSPETWGVACGQILFRYLRSCRGPGNLRDINSNPTTSSCSYRKGLLLPQPQRHSLNCGLMIICGDHLNCGLMIICGDL